MGPLFLATAGRQDPACMQKPNLNYRLTSQRVKTIPFASPTRLHTSFTFLWFDFEQQAHNQKIIRTKKSSHTRSITTFPTYSAHM